jgi:putative NADH-flavin reductase
VRILIIGGTRGIGLESVDFALELGHHVTLLARQPDKVRVRHERLRVVPGDVLDAQSVNSAMKEQDAVILSLGMGITFSPVKLFSEGTRNVLRAMAEHGVRRLVCVTGIGAGDSRGHGGFLYDRIFQALLIRTVYEDKDRQEALIRASDRDWVIAWPGFLTNGPRTGKYRALTRLEGVTAGKISRADVADFLLLKAIEGDEWVGKTPLLTY